MELSHKIIDIYDDLEFAGMEKIATEGLPSEVKSMEMLKQDDLGKMHDDCFGLVCFDKYAHKIRRYPIHDKPHTWLSAQYFDKTAAALPSVLRDKTGLRIKTACLRFDLDNYPKSIDGEFEKKAYASGTFALRSEYPINTKSEVKLAAGYFSKYASQITDPKDRNEFARNVLDQASRLGTTIQEDHKNSLSKYASSHFNESMSHYIESRKLLLPGREKEVEFLEKLAQVKDQESPQNVADILYKFDKMAKINKYWDSKLKNPYESVMGIEKKASHRFDIGDGDMTDADLANVLKSDKAKSYLGAGIVKEAQKNPIGIFESLPKPHQEILYNIHKKLI